MEEFRKHWLHALEELEWIASADQACVALKSPTAKSPTVNRSNMNRSNMNRGECLLGDLSSAGQLTRLGRKSHGALRDAHAQLRTHWPRDWHTSLVPWIGNRLFLSFAGNFAPQAKFTTLVSSAIGQHGQRLREWPRLIDLALQIAYRNQQKLLVAPETTLFEIASNFASKAAIDCVSVEATHTGSLTVWLSHALRDVVDKPDSLGSRILISPVVGCESSLDGPPQDRLAIALADTVYALYIRTKGKIDRLLQSRLHAGEFPIGSVFVALPDRAAKRNVSKTSQDWLDHGAVGWYVPPQLFLPPDEFTDCRNSPASEASSTSILPTQQIASASPRWWYRRAKQSSSHSIAPNAWRWLVHCTRGSAGPGPEESEPRFWQRVWLEGNQQPPHPMRTLNRIITERTLRGTSRITRTSERSVSFSAVPLQQLLQRRKFRSHLGRWDWEPYGLLFCRKALQRLGVRPVVYGDESCFAELPEDEQPFFQPLGQDQEQWKAEEEWRLLGDLKLDQLPPGTVTVFVRSEAEAMQLSRRSPWPILWVN